MKHLFIYFSGFRSIEERNLEGVNSSKYLQVKEYFEKEVENFQVIEYAQTYNWSADISSIDKLIAEHKGCNIYLIASSLGSIPAIYAALKYNLKTALLNPSYFPEETLVELLSNQELDSFQQFKTEISHLLSKQHGQILQIYRNTDDERISKDNFDKFRSIFTNVIKDVFISEDGGHQFNNLKDYLRTIKLYLLVDDYDDLFQIHDEEKFAIKKILYINMDNVIADFNTAIGQLDSEMREKYKDKYDEVPGIFSKLTPFEGAIETVKMFAEYYDIYVLATAPWLKPSVWQLRLHWLQKYFGADSDSALYNRLIISHHKNLLKGDYLIDDSPNSDSENFSGQLIQFGSSAIPDWEAVSDYLFGEFL